jgi:hypothetical protein
MTNMSAFGRILLGLTWTLVCIAFAVASAAKLFNFDLFVRYVSAVTGFSGWASIGIAGLVIGLELAVLAGGLRYGGLSRAASMAALLSSVFLLFHTIRALSGDPLPCSCFGEALKFPPSVFIGIDALMLAGSLWVRSASTAPPPSPSTQQTPPRSKFLWPLAFLMIWSAEAMVVIPRQKAKSIEVSLNPDSALQLASGPALAAKPGSAQATVVVFGDYECPYTQGLLRSDDWQRLLKQDGLKIVWRDLPLSRLHSLAFRLAVLSKAALQRGELLKFQDSLRGVSLSESQVSKWIATLSPSDRAIAEFDVNHDLQLARSIKLNRTPALYVIRGNRAAEAKDAAAALKVFLTEFRQGESK